MKRTNPEAHLFLCPEHYPHTTERMSTWMKDLNIEDYEFHLQHRPAGDWVPSPRSKESPAWHCGDPKKCKTVTHRFVQTTSLHGVQHFCPRRKTIWIHKAVYR
ncbi:hypothetical protein TNCT_461871 [Trichonephila clavata]|uniref:Uncharacterized protein n=1 Tax=Trichonephila clavata TaxID=2740835 RepID=A0A8X6LKS9_TRICU|nr:hypothetical protein TNCT_461871 [Trichonephila clavata]